jgi:hypothetical protein
MGGHSLQVCKILSIIICKLKLDEQEIPSPFFNLMIARLGERVSKREEEES